MTSKRVYPSIFFSLLCFTLLSISWLYLSGLPSVGYSLYDVNTGGIASLLDSARLARETYGLYPASIYGQIFIFYILRPAISFFCGATIMSVISYFMINRPVYFDGHPYKKFGKALIVAYTISLALAVFAPQSFFLNGLLCNLVTFTANNVSSALVSSPIFILAGVFTTYGLVSQRVKVQPVKGWF